MSKDGIKAKDSSSEGGEIARLAGSEEGKARARKLFTHAHLAETKRNYDYAIELYVQGLASWPDAIEEGLKKLRVVATARKQQGGKPPGFLTRRRHSTHGKDAAAALNNALYLFGLDPEDISAMEEILQLAGKAKADGVAQWIAPVLADAYGRAGKLSSNHYQASCEAMFQTAQVAREFENDPGAMDILRSQVATAQIWAKHYPESHDAPRSLSNASGELAIVKGKFAKAEGFTESLKDGEGQRDVRDRDRLVHTADRTQQIIDAARRDWESNRNVPNKLLKLAELLARTETEAGEKEAIVLLRESYSEGQDYVFKQKADEIGLRQMRRRLRGLLARQKADPSDGNLGAEIDRQRHALLAAEIQILEDRQRQYPNELRFKYELGVRYFESGRYDDAIPLLQQSRQDARIRAQSRLYLGRSFFEKRFLEQSAEILKRGLDELETRSGVVALELTYWLARAWEAAGAMADARKFYGTLIQMDYNFRDARSRLERLVSDRDS